MQLIALEGQQDVTLPLGHHALCDDKQSQFVRELDDGTDNGAGIGARLDIGILAELLRDHGCVSVAAYSGRAALDAFSDMRPDAVILDIGLPDISGNEVARRIRASPRGSETALVALTGWGSGADRIDTKAAGFDLHLVKPVEAHALLTVLVGLLGRESLEPR